MRRFESSLPVGPQSAAPGSRASRNSRNWRAWIVALAFATVLPLAIQPAAAQSPAPFGTGSDVGSERTFANPSGDEGATKVGITDETTAPGANAKDKSAEVGERGIPTKSLLGIIREGGLVMLPLLVCSFIMLVFVFERSISLRRGRVVPGPFVKRFLHQLEDGQLDREQALLVCEENGSPVARVFSAAVKKWGRPAVEMEQAIIDSGERVVHELRHYLRVFNGIATVGPMLGLLGTVCGMIRAFNDIATSDAMGRPELLAKGISEALLTTAMGLLVAVPALVLYWWFVSVIDRLTVRIDSLGQDIVGQISAEAIQEKAAAKAPRRKAASSTTAAAA